MQRLNILQRVSVALGLLVIVGVAIVGTGVAAFFRARAAASEMLRLSDQHEALDLIGAAFDEQIIFHLVFLTEPDPARADAYAAAKANTLDYLEAYLATYSGSSLVGNSDALDALNQAVDRQIELTESGQTEAILELENTAVHASHEEFEGVLETEEESLDAEIGVERALLENNLQLAAAVFTGLGGFAVLGAFAVGLYIVRSVRSPLNGAIAVLSSSSAEMAAAVSEVTATVEELSRTASQIAESADGVAHSAEESLRSAETAHRAVDETADGMDALKNKVHALAERILALGEKAQQIGAIVNIINDFADDTHLLALNASIEAAGAGEHGKRFAVVAAEVKRLAERVVQATGEIRVLVNEVQSATNAAVMSAEDSARETERGSTLAGRSGAALSEILQQVGETARRALEISLATEQQRQASEQVARTMHDVSTAAGQLTDTAHGLGSLIGTAQGTSLQASRL